jgi:hypothetical protein
MNQKQCKRLRRWAEALTVGQPAVAYTYQQSAIKRLSNGRLIDKITVRLGACTRAIYQGMKDSQRRAARGE